MLKSQFQSMIDAKYKNKYFVGYSLCYALNSLAMSEAITKKQYIFMNDLILEQSEHTILQWDIPYADSKPKMKINPIVRGSYYLWHPSRYKVRMRWINKQIAKAQDPGYMEW